MPTTPRKLPADVNQRAKKIVDLVTRGSEADQGEEVPDRHATVPTGEKRQPKIAATAE